MAQLFFNTSTVAGVIKLRLEPRAYARLQCCPWCRTKAGVYLKNNGSKYFMECEPCKVVMTDTMGTGAAKTLNSHQLSARRVYRRWNCRPFAGAAA